MADVIAVLNAGSSSLKYSLFAQLPAGPSDLALVARGQAEGLYTSPRFVAMRQRLIDSSQSTDRTRVWNHVRS